MYELGWIRMLSLVLGSSTHSFELMLSAFIFGLAFGGLYVRRRIEKIAPAFHLVVHTAPNTRSKKGELAGYWKTLADDLHWPIEILPIVEKRTKSYSIKEVYFNALLPEQAAERLRQLDLKP